MNSTTISHALIEELRAKEFDYLNHSGSVYLDYAGSGLYTASQVRAASDLLCSNLFSNPHSNNSSSQATSLQISAVEAQLLQFLGVSSSTHSIIWCSNVTAACKLIAENFPVDNHSEFCYTKDNHTSVVGMRAVMRQRGAKLTCVDFDPSKSTRSHNKSSENHGNCQGRDDYNEENWVWQCCCSEELLETHAEKDEKLSEPLHSSFSKHNCLFALPAESNFNGLLYPLSILKEFPMSPGQFGAHSTNPAQYHWFTLLDASKFTASHALNLAIYPADFTLVSGYKTFGFPTGISALICSEKATKLLLSREHLADSSYFGGGTIDFMQPTQNFAVFKQNLQRFEPGTMNFQGILAIKAGIELFQRLTYPVITDYTQKITNYALSQLTTLQHSNNLPLVELYRHDSIDSSSFVAHYGPVLAFNLLSDAGSYISYNFVEELANSKGFSLRTGAFCNLGATAKWLKISDSTLRSNFLAGHSCSHRISSLNNRVTGAIRISFGWPTLAAEIDQFIGFLRQNFLDFSSQSHRKLLEKQFKIEKLLIYPIKSCAGIEIPSISLTPQGLLQWDRQFLITEKAGNILTTKQNPKLIMIQPEIDRIKGILALSAPGMTKINLNLAELSAESSTLGANSPNLAERNDLPSALSVCRVSISTGSMCSAPINAWLSEYLGCEAVLRYNSGAADSSFANSGDLLLINERSVAELTREQEFLVNSGAEKLSAHRFRPNIVISSDRPYIEDLFSSVSIGQFNYNCSLCPRCVTINTNPASGALNNSIFKTVAQIRRRQNRGNAFGVLMQCAGRNKDCEGRAKQGEAGLLKVGDILTAVVEPI
jgi:molybdenum cofactor sulfurtransferase